LESIKPDLINIFQGKVISWRHQAYNKGGDEKARLKMQVSFGILTKEQEETVEQTLREMFLSKTSSHFNYVMDVLLPEAFTLLYAKHNHTSMSKAEAFIYSS